MPTGHTNKKTLTPYRARLLGSLPLEKRKLSMNERVQLNVCCDAGWASEETGFYRLTPLGFAALESAS
jgi:hypothetical protein